MGVQRHVRLISLLHIAACVAAVSDHTCYSPNGSNLTQVQDMTPCNAAATNSHCCNMWDLCLSNGYCFAQGETWHSRLYRGGCTDKAWGKSCPQQCHDGSCTHSKAATNSHLTHLHQSH
ncbi:hypothetical protein K461DRAFT_283196 [Myriangium duriaei CBS 260.36]|uniref:Chitin-binding type-2 domain-containing protein n=1 Tax=Myriangium duriaei CBS 260.36 TaxID=1168546 RepID=A0A9P4ITB2_9PEZI|nr:hypothetical protein K461DRAFT_283196 [Myriangium duriaei CBS 260.36]